jgi:hypothetical protein
MKHNKKQANYTPNLKINPHDLPVIKWTFPEFSIVSKRDIFLTRQFNRRW